MKTLTPLKLITVINVLIATGFSVAGMVNPALVLPAEVTADKGFLILGLYAAARTIPLTVVTIFSITNKRFNTIFTLAFLAGIIQLLDAFVGLLQNDLSKVLGPLVIALVQFVVLYLSRKQLGN